MTDDDDLDLVPPSRHLPVPENGRWWQNWRWWASVAALLIGVALLSSTVILVRFGTVQQQNRDTLERIDHNQAGIDELVAFVHDVQTQQGQGNTEVVDKIYQLLCASNDPIRLEACRRLEVPIPPEVSSGR